MSIGRSCASSNHSLTAPASTLAAVFFICVLAAEAFLALPFLVAAFVLADCLLADAFLLAFFVGILFLLRVMIFEPHRCAVVSWAPGDEFAQLRQNKKFNAICSKVPTSRQLGRFLGQWLGTLAMQGLTPCLPVAGIQKHGQEDVLPARPACLSLAGIPCWFT